MTTSLERAQRLYPSGNLGAFFQMTCADHPQRTAIIDASLDPPRTLSYLELETAVQRGVGAFQALGIAPGDRVAVALPNCAEFIIAFFSLMRIGAIPVLLNIRLGAEVLAAVLRDADCTTVIADLGETPEFDALCAQLSLKHCLSVRSNVPGWRDFGAAVLTAEPSARVEVCPPHAQAFQPYTAGSTGVPKGIVLTHGGMLWGIEHMHAHWPVGVQARGIVAAPLFHKNAMRGTVKRMLRAGGSLVIQRRFRASDYLDAIEKYGVTTCGGVPAMFAEMLTLRERIATGDFSALRYISMGSSVVPKELLARIEAAFPSASVHESYGLTEGGGPFAAPRDGRRTPRGSVGAVAPEVEVRLVDESGRDAAAGELWIRSPYVMAGYAKRPELTRERLVDGWLKTGDRFQVDDEGFYYFLGRSDDMFVCGGENIYPKDVEDLILRHPSVADAVVVPLEHETKGYAPAALVVARSGHDLSPQALQDHCAANGPAFAIPRGVLLADQIPVTSAGKPDRVLAKRMLYDAFGTLRSRKAVS